MDITSLALIKKLEKILKEGSMSGEDGVGIAKIEQTTTSTADDGNNVITVTLTNGQTSTFTIQNGSKGFKGDTGSTGASGKDGTSVTVTKVNESTADGGSNVVTFSDGKTVTIKNGSKGSAGANGTNGTNGKDGLSITAINLVQDGTGVITSGTATLSDNSVINITITTDTVE